jgi:hypothetical protein
MTEILAVDVEEGGGYYRRGIGFRQTRARTGLRGKIRPRTGLRHPVAVECGSASTGLTIWRCGKSVRKLFHNSIHRM